jgi:16S rRNA (guanine527-N7)-methyltransferase
VRGARGNSAANRTRHGRPTIDRRCDKRARRERSPDGPRRHDRQEECLDRPRQPLPTRVDTLPPLPAVFDEALDTGLLELGQRLTPGARSIITDHARLLLAWNEAINLTSIRAPADIAVRHVIDSLAAVRVLQARRVGRVQVDGFVDLGSGGGYPGIPLAAVLPVRRAVLVDSVGKKAAFLAAAVTATGLADRVDVAAVRSEDLARDVRHRERWPAVLARAVGALDELVELAFPLLQPGGVLVAWKRGDIEEEIAAARRALAVLGGGRIESVPVTATGLDEHRLVVVTKRGRTSDGFPRDPATRRRRPW